MQMTEITNKVNISTKPVKLSELAQVEMEDRLALCFPEPAYVNNIPTITTAEQALELTGFVGWCLHWGDLKKGQAKVFVLQTIETTHDAWESVPEELVQLYDSL